MNKAQLSIVADFPVKNQKTSILLSVARAATPQFVWRAEK